MNSPGKNTGVGSHPSLQGIFPTQGSNPGLLHCRQIPYHLSLQGNPMRERQGQECLGFGHQQLIFGEQGEQEEEFGSEHKEFHLGHVAFEIPITDERAVRC